MRVSHTVAQKSLLLTLLLTSIACGRKSSPPERQENRHPHLRNIPELSAFSIADPTCHQSSSDQSVQFQGESALVSWEVDRSVQTRSVKLIKAGEIYRRTCSNSLQSCTDRAGNPRHWERQNPGFPVKLCTDPNTLPAHSIERISADILLKIESARQTFHDHFPQHTLPRLNISLFPVLETVIPRSHQGRRAIIETNNVLYVGKDALILVLPPTQDSPQNLWKSQFVLAHEFGHHIEQSILQLGGIHASHATVAPPFSSHFSNEPSLDQASVIFPFSGLAELETNPEAKTWEAIGEGFADIIGYLTPGGKEDLAEDPCFKHVRNPAYGFFTPGQQPAPKVLTQRMWRQFLQLREQPGTCSRPNPTDPHTMGAILAYSLWSASTGALSHLPDLSHEESLAISYRITVNWLKKLNQATISSSANQLSPFALLAKAAIAQIGAIEEQVRQAGDDHFALSQEEICRSVLEVLPVLQDSLPC